MRNKLNEVLLPKSRIQRRTSHKIDDKGKLGNLGESGMYPPGRNGKSDQPFLIYRVK